MTDTKNARDADLDPDDALPAQDADLDEAVAATEARMAEGIRQGMSVLEVLERLGYEQMLDKNKQQ